MVNRITQTTEFTCGPVCLIHALTKLMPGRPVEPVEEFLIWREVNSIFMGGTGHAGCTPYGLAVAALKRGLHARIHTNNLAGIDATLSRELSDPAHRPVYDMVTAHDRRQALASGLIIEEGPMPESLIADLLVQGAVPLMLVRAFGDNELHWVVAHHMDGDTLHIMDPYHLHRDHDWALPEALLPATHAMPYDSLRPYARHEADSALILALGA